VTDEYRREVHRMRGYVLQHRRRNSPVGYVFVGGAAIAAAARSLSVNRIKMRMRLA
jgi:hypothetical protein